MAIVIPTINRKDFLFELLNSLEQQIHSFEKLLIIDNGKQSIDISNLKLKTKTKILEPETNLGVAKSWNCGIREFKDYDYILFLNDDIVLGNDQLEEIKSKLDSQWVTLTESDFSVFALSKNCWEYFLDKDKYVFDENFYPAYYEDVDFYYRLNLLENNLIGKEKVFNPLVYRKSMSREKDKRLVRKFQKNRLYYKMKWGGLQGKEKFEIPFNGNTIRKFFVKFWPIYRFYQNRIWDIKKNSYTE